MNVKDLRKEFHSYMDKRRTLLAKIEAKSAHAEISRLQSDVKATTSRMYRAAGMPPSVSRSDRDHPRVLSKLLHACMDEVVSLQNQQSSKRVNDAALAENKRLKDEVAELHKDLSRSQRYTKYALIAVILCMSAIIYIQGS